MASSKANVLLVGSGGVGTMCAYALESGGLAEVTAVLRSNYVAVTERGFDISSIDHGEVKAWKPKKVVNSVPDVSGGAAAEAPFDFIVVATKNVADIAPAVADIIRPAVTPGRSAIVLLQNGLNIEVPVMAAFPQNVIISGISLIGAAETSHGVILHNDPDRLHIGPFDNGNLPAELQAAAAERFAAMYGASGKVAVDLVRTPREVAWARWRKLIYNACYNSIAAVTLLDTGRLRLARSPVEELLRPAMLEIVAIAKALGHELPLVLVDQIIDAEPIEIFFKPSMQQDVEKGNYTEFENIVGEPLRTAQRVGVPTPTLTVLYGILRAIQWRTKEQKGLSFFPIAMTVQTIRSILGVPPTTPTLADSVLIIVDAQGEYATGLLKIPRIAETRAAIKALLDRYRAAGSSVVHVVNDVPAGAPIFTPGTDLAAILEELQPVAGEPVVHKLHATAFTGTKLQEELVKTGKKKLAVVGYMAHHCVSATIRAAGELGYDVYAVQDAIGDRDIPGATAEELVRISLAEVADVVSVTIKSEDIQ